MRKQFTGKLNVFRAYQADTKYTATVDVEGQQFYYYPARSASRISATP